MVLAKFAYPEYGYQSDQDTVKKYLKVDEEYELEHVDMGQSHTTVYLRGFSHGFNSVHFTFSENGNSLDIFQDPRFNTYMNRKVKNEKERIRHRF